jgi:HK97 family phage prohead protease
MERRFFRAGTDLRADSQGDEMCISGYAARFNVLSHELNGFRETLSRNCFARSLQSDRDVKMLFNHDPSLILGRKQNGTLSVNEDDKGLRFSCRVADTQAGRDAFKLVQRSDISECSFAFSVDDGCEDWDDCQDDETGERYRRRTIRQASLWDTSIVSSPAYPGTTVTANSRQLNSTRSMLDYFPSGGLPTSFSPELRALLLRREAMQSNSSKQKLMSLILG